MTEYVKMSDPNYTMISDAVRASYPNSCICWVEYVRNDALDARFDDYYKSVGGEVQRLFHGTNEEVVGCICVEGFKPQYNKMSAFGKGVYFSTRAQYSKDYAPARNDGLAFMIVADVAIGKVARGSINAVIPAGYDSFTDNPKRPDMYIVDKAEACVPKFIVSFAPNVK